MSKRERPSSSIPREIVLWIVNIIQYGNVQMRWWLVFPLLVFVFAYAVAEVTGIEEILWGLLIALFVVAGAILMAYPFFLTLMSAFTFTRPVMQVLTVGFLLLLALIIFGFAMPFHILNPPFVRLLPTLCLIALAALLYYSFLAGAPLPNLVPWLRVFFIGGFIALLVLTIYLSGWRLFIAGSEDIPSKFPTSDPNPFSIFDADAEIVCSPETEELRVGTTSFEIHDECWSKKYKNPKGAEKIDWSLSIRYREPDVCVDIWFPFKHGEKILDYQRGTVISCDQPMPSNHPEEFRVKSKYNPQTFSVHHKN